LQYSKTTRKKTPESKNRNDEFPENHQKCFGFFGSDSSRSILEPPEKKGEIITKISVPDRKPPEKKSYQSQKRIETMNFLKNHQKCLGFFGSDGFRIHF